MEVMPSESRSVDNNAGYVYKNVFQRAPENAREAEISAGRQNTKLKFLVGIASYGSIW